MGDVVFILNGWTLNSPESVIDRSIPFTQWAGSSGWWKLPGNTGEAVQHVARDGAYLTPVWQTAPRFTLSGVMNAPSRPELRAEWDRFKAGLPLRSPGPLVAIEDGLSRYRMVRVDQPEVVPVWVTDTKLEFSVQVVSADTRLFTGAGPDDPPSGFADARLPITEGGLRIPGASTADTNWTTNPSFEVDTSGWVGVGGTLTRETASPPAWIVGTAWGRLTTGSGATRPGVLAASTTDQRVNLAPGDWAAASMLMANDSGYTSQIGIRFYDSTNTRISESMSTPTNNTGGRVTHSAQAPAGTIYAQPVPYLYNGGTVIPTGVKLDFDALKISAAPTQVDAVSKASDYYDGSTPASGNYTFRWTGTSGKSSSEKVLAGGVRVPFRIGAKVTRSSINIPVTGTAAPQVTAVIRAAGEPLVRPAIKDQDGNVMAFDLTLDVGQYLELDWDDKSIMINGQASRRSALLGDWLPLKSTEMTWSFSADSFAVTNAASLTVTWREAWI